MNAPSNSDQGLVPSKVPSHKSSGHNPTSVRSELDGHEIAQRRTRVATTRTSLHKFNTDTDNLIWEAALHDASLHRMHGLFDVRLQRIKAAVAIKTRTAISDDPLDCEAAVKHLAKRVQTGLRREFEWIAVHRGPDALREAQSRAGELAALLDAFERSSCEGVIGRRSGPSWLDYRAACEEELEMFRLWALSVDGAAKKRESNGVAPDRRLTPAEQRIWEVMGAAGKTSAQIAREAGFSSPDTVRGHLGRMKGKVPVDKNTSGRFIRGVPDTGHMETTS